MGTTWQVPVQVLSTIAGFLAADSWFASGVPDGSAVPSLIRLSFEELWGSWQTPQLEVCSAEPRGVYIVVPSKPA